MSEAREFDVIVYGASGFTGRLVAAYLQRAYPPGSNVAWAMAGRDIAKLEGVKAEIGAGVPVIAANARDSVSLEAMARRAKVVLTTVGPYQLYGEPLVAACTATGTDYVDLCGEPNWMAEMIAKYSDAAKASGARITFSCGFDSIPFDGGVFFLEQETQKRFGAPAVRVRGRVRKMKGGFSGGTMASMLETMKAVKANPRIGAVLIDPFALSPEKLTAQPNGDVAVYDETIPSWSTPFVMAAINTKNVHRTNALLGYAYGRAFQYDEMMLTGDGVAGEKRAKAAVSAARMQRNLLGFGPTRAFLTTFVLPKPGQGPSKQERETGMYDVLYVGETAKGETLRASVHGDKDPGYASTSKMIAEAALCLAQDVDRGATPGGLWTPMSAMGLKLIDRLQAKAGLTFKVEN